MKERFLYKRWLPLLLVLSLLAGCGLSSPVSVPPAPTADGGSSMMELTLLTPPPEEESSASPEATAPPTEAPPTPDPDADPTPVPTPELPATPTPSPRPTEAPLAEDGSYTSKEDVALYIYIYGHLPSNFITKRQAQNLGWSGGGLDPYAYGCSIGGDRFGNYEGLLPERSGRFYTECDIDTLHARGRGAKRIVFSNDGLIYYTGDHYESFTLLYGEE